MNAFKVRHILGYLSQRDILSVQICLSSIATLCAEVSFDSLLWDLCVQMCTNRMFNINLVLAIVTTMFETTGFIILVFCAKCKNFKKNLKHQKY